MIIKSMSKRLTVAVQSDFRSSVCRVVSVMSSDIDSFECNVSGRVDDCTLRMLLVLG